MQVMRIKSDHQKCLDVSTNNIFLPNCSMENIWRSVGRTACIVILIQDASSFLIVGQ